MFGRRYDNDEPPDLARRIYESLLSLHRKVDANMKFDIALVARLVAGARALVDGLRAKDQVIAARDAEIAELKAAAGLAADAEAAEDADEAASNAALTEAADAVDALITGPETPDVAPVAPEDVAAVVAGDQPVVDTSGAEIVADEPQTGENPGL